jgi:hypothetical protein
MLKLSLKEEGSVPQEERYAAGSSNLIHQLIKKKIGGTEVCKSSKINLVKMKISMSLVFVVVNCSSQLTHPLISQLTYPLIAIQPAGKGVCSCLGTDLP